MYINPIQSINFYSKQRFITNNMKSSIDSLLIRINGNIDRIQDGDHFKSSIITKLHLNNDAIFEDERRLTKKLNHKEQLKGFSVLTIGKKTVMDIDNQNGEIIDYKKPFYKPWFYVFWKAEKILKEMRANFYDNDLVQKERLTISELTPEGEKKMQKFVLKVEKQRLENVIKNMEKDSK